MIMTEEYEQEFLNEENLKNKNIEPEIKLSEHINRNFQLGNIDAKQANFFFSRIEVINKYLAIPNRYGGFLAKELALMNMRAMETQLVVSGSVGATVRQINASSKRIVENRYSEDKNGARGKFF